MIRKLNNYILRFNLSRKVNNLTISESGIDEDGDAYVRLENGLIFYGPKRVYPRDKTFYKLLNSKIKSKLHVDAIQVAMDIIIRYYEGGLKYGGPKKQKFYSVGAGDVVAEMGAYQGFCSIKLAQQVGDKGRVVCIEPNRNNFRLLEKNMKANNFTNVVSVNKGVWDESKELIFNMVKDDGQSSSVEMTYNGLNKYKIEADTLDVIFKDINVFPRDFMIIQLNGAEINALRGLDSFRPKNLTIAARYDTEDVDAAIAIQELLAERGYKVTVIEDDYVFAELVTP